MRRWGFVVTVVSMVVLIAGAEMLEAGPRFRRSSMEGGDGSGPSVDIIVHEVNVDPMAARVGDTIRFEMVIEDHGNPFKSTIPIGIKANGKVVASQLLRFGSGGGAPEDVPGGAGMEHQGGVAGRVPDRG